MIPSVSQCLELMAYYGMLANIREHSLMVGRVAGLIGQELARAGWAISLDVVVSGALLHDIAKTASLGRDIPHDRLGRDICLEHGFDELAEIVAEHVVLKNGVPRPCCTEKEIVYYADKRVLHEEVVALEARLDYILARYGNGDAELHSRIRRNFSQAHEIEEHLFAVLPFSPGDLAGLVSGQPSRLDAFSF